MAKHKQTKEEFIQEWLDDARLDRKALRVLGLDAYECGCGESSCPGWIMAAK